MRNWHWTEIELHTFREIGAFTVDAIDCYGYAVLFDGASHCPVNCTFWVRGDGDARRVESEARAMLHAGPLPGTWEFPPGISARFIRLYHRSTTDSPHAIRTLTPGR